MLTDGGIHSAGILLLADSEIDWMVNLNTALLAGVLSLLGYALYSFRKAENKLDLVMTLLIGINDSGIIGEIKSLRDSRHQHANAITANTAKIANLEERVGSIELDEDKFFEGSRSEQQKLREDIGVLKEKVRQHLRDKNGEPN